MKKLLILPLLFALSVNAKPKQKAFEDLREKIVIVDTGISYTPIMEKFLCKQKNLHKDFTGQGLNDVVGHGTHLAHLIGKQLDFSKFCIVIIKFFHKEKIVGDYGAAVTYAASLNPRVINLSLNGLEESPRETMAINKALRQGTSVFVSAGNESQNLTIICNAFPACIKVSHPNFYVVSNGARTPAGIVEYAESSNTEGPARYLANGQDVPSFVGYKKIQKMTGTSQATAILANKYIRQILTPLLQFQKRNQSAQRDLQYTFGPSPSLQSIFHWPKRNHPLKR